MSEEEIIKVVKNVANGLKFTQEFQGNEMYREDIQAIQGLLDLYQKEKEKNKKLFLNYEKRVDELEYQLSQSIDKDKIREKIYPSPDNYIPVEVQMSEMYRELEKLVKESE